MSKELTKEETNLEALHGMLFEEIRLLRNDEISTIRARATASLAKHIIQLYALQLAANNIYGREKITE